MPSSSDAAMYVDENEEMVITGIRATEVALALGRLPAGFYTSVQHSGQEWRTKNKPTSSVDDDVVEWDESIPIPFDLSATLCLRVHASFEFQPMLGSGEELRRFTVTVKQLLDRSASGLPFTFCSEDGEVISPCSSILVTVQRRRRKICYSPVSGVLELDCTVADWQDQLEDVTNQGHTALSGYRKHGRQSDLQHAIELFERALDTCPMDHPCRAAARSNLAMAMSIHCWVDDADPFLDIPLDLYRNALSARPLGHPDRPSTLIQLAIVHLRRFEKRRHEDDAAQVETLLHEAMDLTSPGSHEKRAVVTLLEMRARQGKNPAVPTTLETPLLIRFEQPGDINDHPHKPDHLDNPASVTSS